MVTKKKKVLVIDDEPDMRDLVSMRIQVSGHDVVTAINGEEGLEKVESENPDLIVLDKICDYAIIY